MERKGVASRGKHAQKHKDVGVDHMFGSVMVQYRECIEKYLEK